MSNQRKIRADLKHGMHQYLMHAYHSYRETLSDDEAKKHVRQAIESEYAFFSDKILAFDSTLVHLTEKINILQKKLESSSHYDEQLYLSEKLDVLQKTIEVLEWMEDSDV